MKILHTADWHIGKILHKYSLSTELDLFFDWMINYIVDEDIDLLIVSGDIFDLANPTIRDKEQYYDIVLRLYNTGCKVIFTGGNHDSVGELNAPKEILSAINITVVGGATETIADELIPVKNEKGDIELIVAAVPFLRDRDLRTQEDGIKYDSRVEAIREGIKAHYASLGDICSKEYPHTMALAMGHLYASGVTVSESEREIHVGNQAAVRSNIFPEQFKYVALGHIHKPQIVDSNPRIRYSGSPIALSFSEKADTKQVILIETHQGEVTEVTDIAVPQSRELKKITGTLEEIEKELKHYKPDYTLPSFVEVEVTEKEFSSITLAAVEELVLSYSDSDKFKILKHKTVFENKQLDTAHLFTEGTSIEELKPIDVFQKRLDSEDIDEASRKVVEEAFLELLESL